MNSICHTLGDSTLDNLFWVIDPKTCDVQEAKSRTVEGQLQQLCNKDGTRTSVISHAYDGFTTKSVLDGDTVGRVLPQNGRVKTCYMQEKVKNDQHIVYPLQQLKESVEDRPLAVHYVVLSVGGNDFRENLWNPLRLIWSISSIQKRYLQIAQKIQSIKRDIRPIFMLQYKTDKNNDPYCIYPLMKWLGIFAKTIQCVALAILLGAFALTITGKISLFASALFAGFGFLGLFYTHKISPITQVVDLFRGKNDPVATFDKLAETFYKPILAYAKKHKIPVLDLTHTFDPNKPLYTCGIEPNVQGGALIAEGIHHILTHHDFSSPNKVYSFAEKIVQS